MGVPEIINHCPHCGLNFRSLFSSMILSGTHFSCKDNSEECPSCHKIIKVTDVTSFEIDGKNRLIPMEASATPTINPNLIPLTKEIYFTISRNGINSFTWKVWVNKEDVYVSCREIQDWKMSFHKTGKDQIGFTQATINNNRIKLADGQHRLFFTADRVTPYAAHAMRIARIVINSKSEFSEKIEFKPLKSKRKSLQMIYPMAEKYSAFDLFYTEDHPGKYEETKFFSDQSIALLPMSKGHVLSIIPVSEIEGVTLGRFHAVFSYSFMSNEKVDADFDFGISNRNTFLINIDHI